MVNFPTVYRAARLDSGMRVAIENRNFPLVLKPNSLVIKPLYIGICRADVKEVAASRQIVPKNGPLFGHEFIGRVMFKGETEYAEDALVTFNPNVTGKRTTGFAEYFFIEGTPDELREAVIPVPEKLSIEPPWLPEPMACIVHSLEKFIEQRSWLDFKNKKIAIMGMGNSGIEFGLLANYNLAGVTLFNRREDRVIETIAREMFLNAEYGLIENIGAGRDEFDAAFVAPTMVGQDMLRISHQIVRNGGSIHLYGGTTSGMKFLESGVDIDAVRRQEKKVEVNFGGKTIFLSGAYGCSRRDFEETFCLYRDDPEFFPLHRLITKTITLEELPGVIMGMAAGTQDFPGKVIIRNAP